VLTTTSAATVSNKMMRLIGVTSSFSRPTAEIFEHNGSIRGSATQSLMTDLLVLSLLWQAAH
jgi:hypothetical protein